MALDIQAVVQARIVGWRARGYTIGFCIGLTKGPATVGRMGYEGRTDHTAISSNVNLAHRMCAVRLHRGGQILIQRGWRRKSAARAARSRQR
jgi:adenylate cyclase